jgi:rhodanese-related sulfurtransferase
MKKKDQNIIIIIIFIIIALFIWMMTRYDLSKKQALKSKELAKQLKIDAQKNEAIQKAKPIKKSVIPIITTTDLKQKIITSKNEITLIDTRPIKQFAIGHIKGSIPIDNFDSTRASREIVFITAGGNEDPLLSQYNNLSHTKKVFNLSGGINQWTEDGYPIISTKIIQNFENSSKVNFIEPRDLNNINQTDEQQQNIIIDTRRIGNFDKEHIPNAINIPFDELEYRYQEIPINKMVYVYGADDSTSFNAGVLLYNLNFISAHTIKGGFNAWKEYGYPIATD